jgi:hypothetical protein
VKGFGDREALVSRTFAHCDVDGLAGGRQHQHRAVVAAMRGAHEGAHRGGLARPGRRGQRLDQPG